MFLHVTKKLRKTQKKNQKKKQLKFYYNKLIQKEKDKKSELHRFCSRKNKEIFGDGCNAKTMQKLWNKRKKKQKKI